MALTMNRGMFADPRMVTYPTTTTTAPRVGTTVQMPTAPAETMPRPTRTREPYIDSGPIIANPGGQLPVPTKQAPIVVAPQTPVKTGREEIYQSPPIIAQPGGMLTIPTKQEPTKQAPIVVDAPVPTKGIYQSPPIIAQPGQAPIPTQPTTKGQPVRTTGGIKPPMPAPAPAPAPVEEPSTVKTLFSEYFPETKREPTSPYESPPIIAQPGQLPLAPPPRPVIETVVEDEIRPSEIVTDDGRLIGSGTTTPREPFIDSGPIIAQPGTTLPVPEPAPVPAPAPAPVPVLTPEPPVQTVERREPFIDSGPIIAQPGGMLPIPSTPPPRVDDDRTVEEGTEVRATEQFDEMGQQPTVVPPPPSAPDDDGGFVEEGGEVRATEDFEAMGQQAGTPAPAPAQAAVDPRALYLPDPRPPVEAAPEGMFTFIEGRERVKGDADTYLYNQISQNSEQVSIDDLRAYYNDPEKVNRLPEVFGTFENYLAYMQEREELIRAGEYDIGNWGDSREGLSQEQLMILEGEDLFIDPTTGVDKTSAERNKRYAQRSAYERWINSDANKALMEKYGVAPVVYSDSGDKFEWNGTAYVKTQDVRNPGFGDYFKAAVLGVMGAGIGSAVSTALFGTGAAAGGAGAAASGAGAGAGAAAGTAAGTAAATTTTGAFLQGAVSRVIGSAFAQGAATGSIDASQLLVAGITGGIGSVADGIKSGALAGTALDNAVWDLSETLGASVEETASLLEGVATGAVTGGDVQSIVEGAVQQYTSSQIKNQLVNAFGSEIDIPNVFDEDTTTIPISALDPFVETAVGAAFEGEINAEDVAQALYDYSQEEGSFAFLDPGLDLPDFDIDSSLLSQFETPEALRQFEDIVRAAGRETEDVVREIVSPLGDIGTAIGQPIGEALASLEDAIRELIPEVETPELPEVDLPSVETPDLPSISFPSISISGLGGIGGAGAAREFQRTDPGGITYDPTLPELYLIPPRGMLV